MSNNAIYQAPGWDYHDDGENLEDLPRFEKRRRPSRNTFHTSVRRAVVRSYRRRNSSPSRSAAGFHRRIVKKPLHGIG